jgi:glycosyltransferase involved in cell wall biosynthesis
MSVSSATPNAAAGWAGARALLYPIQYPEAFGLVLVEAMFCGTPVAALRLGAVPEIIEEGVSGCLVTSTAEMPGALGKCFVLDRARIRRQAEQRFSSGQMARAYLELYEKIVSRR